MDSNGLDEKYFYLNFPKQIKICSSLKLIQDFYTSNPNNSFNVICSNDHDDRNYFKQCSIFQVRQPQYSIVIFFFCLIIISFIMSWSWSWIFSLIKSAKTADSLKKKSWAKWRFNLGQRNKRLASYPPRNILRVFKKYSISRKFNFCLNLCTTLTNINYRLWNYSF